MRTDPYRILAVVLSALAAGFAGMLILSDPAETFQARILLTSWMGPIPPRVGVALIVCIAVGLAVLWSYSASRNHVAAVNWTALAGGLPMLTLAASEPSCNPIGIIATGLMPVAGFAVAGWVYGMIPGNASGPSANYGNFSLIFFMRNSVGAYMVVLALFAVVAAIIDNISVDLMGAILVFCGLGVTAAATLPEKWGWKIALPLSGVLISLLGAGIQMDQAFGKYTAEFETWHFLFLAALLSMIVIFPLALQTECSMVRQAGLISGAVVAGALTFALATIMLWLIVDECGADPSHIPSGFVIVILGLIGLCAAVSAYVVIRRM